MTAPDPRLDRHRPALRYDSQEPYRAISAASITDWLREHAAGPRRQRARARRRGAEPGLSLAATRPARRTRATGSTKRPDPLAAARTLQADPRYADRCYGRVVPDGGRTWLQYWLWSYDNPKQLLGFGRHEGDWEMVQVGLGPDDVPEVVTCSQHEGGEAKDWADAERLGAHPVIYVAPLSHANYFESGAHPYVIGIDNPDGRVEPVLPRVEPFGDWAAWPGRWGSSMGVLGRLSGGRLGGRSPVGPGRQGQKWDSPAAFHRRAQLSRPGEALGRLMRQIGRLSYPRLRSLEAHREDGRLLVGWELDRAALRGAGQLLVTLHEVGREEEVLLSHAARIRGRAGTVEVPLTQPLPAAAVVRASAFNALRQRSDPLEAEVA